MTCGVRNQRGPYILSSVHRQRQAFNVKVNRNDIRVQKPSLQQDYRIQLFYFIYPLPTGSSVSGYYLDVPVVRRTLPQRLRRQNSCKTRRQRFSIICPALLLRCVLSWKPSSLSLLRGVDGGNDLFTPRFIQYGVDQRCILVS